MCLFSIQGNERESDEQMQDEEDENNVNVNDTLGLNEGGTETTDAGAQNILPSKGVSTPKKVFKSPKKTRHVKVQQREEIMNVACEPQT